MKKTRKMVASLVAIVICFAMLFGTTYAWFTDSVINTNNIIKSGNVDVELMHKSNDNSDYEEVAGTTKLFVNKSGNAILWEPEASATETFEVKNVGTLALKYEFRIKALAKELNEKGNSLLDVLTLTVNGEIANFGDTFKDTIVAGAEPKTYIAKINWEPTENDNEYKNLSFVLGIELVATQFTAEEDGTGTGFDDTAVMPNVSTDVVLDDLQGQNAVLETKGENPVSATLPAGMLNELLASVETVSLVHSEPIVDNGTITFKSIEIVDENGNIIDLEDLNTTEKVSVTLPAQETFAPNTQVSIYHDGKLMAIATVAQDKTISYEVAHFCEVVLAEPDGVIDTDIELNNALSKGGEIVLPEAIEEELVIDSTLVVPEGVEVTLDLAGKKLCANLHKSVGSVIKNQGVLTVKNGTISSKANNGGSAIVNNGEATVENVVLNGAPNADGSWPSYTVNNTGVMEITNSTITSYHGALCSYGEGAVVTMNNSEIDMAGIPGFTSHGIYTYSAGKVIVNGGTYANKATDQNASGASIINGYVEINDGEFSGRIENYYGTPVIKGGNFSENPKAAFIAEGYEVKSGDGIYYVVEEGTFIATTPSEFNEAINGAVAAGETEVYLGSGNYIIPDSAQGKTLTFIGNGKTVVATQDDGSYEGCDYSLDGATVTFKNITINTNSETYTGYARLKATYENCTINGTYTLYDNSTFNNCTFNVSGDVYSIWTWGASKATFNNCTFNTDGKAILLYGGTNTTLTVDGCTFNDKGGLSDLKAAIETGNDYNVGKTLIVNNTTVNGYEINDKGINTGTTLWANKNSMGKDLLNVIVDGVDVY